MKRIKNFICESCGHANIFSCSEDGCAGYEMFSLCPCCLTEDHKLEICNTVMRKDVDVMDTLKLHMARCQEKNGVCKLVEKKDGGVCPMCTIRKVEYGMMCNECRSKCNNSKK